MTSENVARDRTPSDTASPIENRVGQVFVPVSDLARSAAWYSRLLGLPPAAASHGGTIYDLPTTAGPGLALDATRGAGDPDSPPRFFWWTRDMAATVAHLARLGVAVELGPQDIGSVTILQFRDPDGQLLMVCQANHPTDPPEGD